MIIGPPIPPVRFAWPRKGLRVRHQVPWLLLGGHVVFAAGLTIASALAPQEKPLDPVLMATSDGLAHGATVYRRACVMCHDASGLGKPRLGTPLVGAPWLKTCRSEHLAAILLHGVTGPIPGTHSSHPIMPGLGSWLDDHEIADVATFVLRTWGERPSRVSELTVQAIRQANPGRMSPWTMEEMTTRDPTKPKPAPIP